MSRRFLKQLDVAPHFAQGERRGIHRDLFGGGGGGSNSTTTIQNADPWSGVQPYLKDIFQRAQDQYGAGPYSGPYITPQSPYSQMAINFQGQNALTAGSPIQNAYSESAKTIRGDYLSPDSNPYLKGAVQQALDQTTQNVNSQFKGDNFQSSANQEWLAKKLAGTALPIYAQNYQNERGNQLNATANAGNVQSMVPNALAAAGSAAENRGQQEIAAGRQAYQAPWENLSNYVRTVSGQPGGTSSTQTPYFTNPISSLLGAGIGGLSLYNGLNQAGLLSSAAAAAAPIASYGLADLGMGSLGYGALML